MQLIAGVGDERRHRLVWQAQREHIEAAAACGREEKTMAVAAPRRTELDFARGREVAFDAIGKPEARWTGKHGGGKCYYRHRRRRSSN
jgi:hypothetical protein